MDVGALILLGHGVPGRESLNFREGQPDHTYSSRLAALLTPRLLYTTLNFSSLLDLDFSYCYIRYISAAITAFINNYSCFVGSLKYTLYSLLRDPLHDLNQDLFFAL